MGDRTVSIRLLAPLALAVALLLIPAIPVLAGGVAILNTVLTDNGDDDGYVGEVMKGPPLATPRSAGPTTPPRSAS